MQGWRGSIPFLQSLRSTHLRRDIDQGAAVDLGIVTLPHRILIVPLLSANFRTSA